jgi:hypothetical protein
VPKGGTRHATRTRLGWLASEELRHVPAASTLLDHPRTVYLREVDPLPLGRLAHARSTPPTR